MNTLLIADGKKLSVEQVDGLHSKIGTTCIFYLDSLGQKGKSLQKAIESGYEGGSYTLAKLEQFIKLTEATHVKATDVIQKKLQERGCKAKFI